MIYEDESEEQKNHHIQGDTFNNREEQDNEDPEYYGDQNEDFDEGNRNEGEAEEEDDYGNDDDGYSEEDQTSKQSKPKPKDGSFLI